MKKIRLGTKILIGLVLGAIVGFILGERAEFFQPLGDLFIEIVQILVIPLVLATITNSILSVSSFKNFGRMGIKTVLYFLGTTTVAVIIGLVVALAFQPGAGVQLDIDTSDFTPPDPVTPVDMLFGLVPSNPIASMAEGDVLQVIVFSLLLGSAILLVGEKGKPMADFFNSFAEVMFKFVHIIIQIAPYGVFCLIAPTTGLYGWDVLLPLGSVILTLLAAVIVHVCIVYLPILKLIGRYPIIHFFKNASEALLMAFSSALSSAAYPFSMKAQENMRVSKKIRSFVISLGMTVNMDGTSLYLAISSIFIANIYGLELGGGEFALIVLSGVLASIGATAVPMAGLIMLTLVLTAVGLPLEGLALVAGIDRILDMLRTFTNVLGDNVGSVTIASTEKEIATGESVEEASHSL